MNTEQLQTAAAAAIENSRQFNRIAELSITAADADIEDVIAELSAIYDGEIDYAVEPDGTYDVWGASEDGVSDWRLNVTLN